MNRAEKREKLREMKRNPMAKICPHCLLVLQKKLLKKTVKRPSRGLMYKEA